MLILTMFAVLLFILSINVPIAIGLSGNNNNCHGVKIWNKFFN